MSNQTTKIERDGHTFYMKKGIARWGAKYHTLTAVVWPIHWAHIHLDCIGCDQSIGLKFESNEASEKMTNEQAGEVFRAEGWTIAPTRCPECAKKAADG